MSFTRTKKNPFLKLVLAFENVKHYNEEIVKCHLLFMIPQRGVHTDVQRCICFGI